MDHNKEKLLQKCNALPLKVAITYLTSEYACEFIIISSKGVASFWTPIDIEWPVYHLKKNDISSLSSIKEKISNNKLVYEDIKDTSLELFSEQIVDSDSEEDYSRLFSGLLDVSSVSEEGLYCVSGGFDSEGNVSKYNKLIFFTDLNECIKYFEKQLFVDYSPWEDMSLKEMEDWLNTYEEIDGFPVCELRD